MLAKYYIITFHLFNLYIDLFDNYLELACCLPVPVLDATFITTMYLRVYGESNKYMNIIIKEFTTSIRICKGYSKKTKEGHLAVTD